MNSNSEFSCGVRIHWIDIMKGIGILLVAFQHIISLEIPSRIILSFHMPMFFLVSGYLQHDKPASQFFPSRIRSLLIPTLLFELLNILICIAISNSSTFNYKVLQFGGEWFVITLFITETLDFLLHPVTQKLQVLWRFFLAFFLMGIGFLHCQCMNSTTNGKASFVALSLVAYFFFCVGHLANQFKLPDCLTNQRFINLLLLIISCLLLLICVKYNSTSILMHAGIFGNLPLFIIGALSGSLALCIISILINECFILEFFGRNSLLFLFIHIPVFRVLLFLFNCLKVNNHLIETIVFIVTIFLCSVFSIVINRIFPILSGKKAFDNHHSN